MYPEERMQLAGVLFDAGDELRRQLVTLLGVAESVTIARRMLPPSTSRVWNGLAHRSYVRAIIELAEELELVDRLVGRAVDATRRATQTSGTRVG